MRWASCCGYFFAENWRDRRALRAHVLGRQPVLSSWLIHVTCPGQHLSVLHFLWTPVTSGGSPDAVRWGVSSTSVSPSQENETFVSHASGKVAHSPAPSASICAWTCKAYFNFPHKQNTGQSTLEKFCYIVTSPIYVISKKDLKYGLSCVWKQIKCQGLKEWPYLKHRIHRT